ncbi:GNAT family N-acetyltransferase [Aliigemmobacter aestuarii]|uniref:GNAT family N-acetyltransferase n=2 Tax=Aliigemmobacter aestuarii TaxID=1445661 RepID=A0A4S3MTI2_9RHOB|nr:GNAT family N-acetyltransferase [Gemmobacter aestuarii]THD85888.1 GNAT family N-acetyltransferase [Gemmobacter aestuarii]
MIAGTPPVIAPTRDIAACRHLRRVVFIEEQGVSEADEVDDKDDQAIHLLATIGGRPVGSARILLMGDTGKIGRVCVLKEARGTGLGAALIRAAVAELRGQPGVSRAKLGAQTHAIGFYEKLGFTAFGPEYDDAGIPHRDMLLTL